MSKLDNIVMGAGISTSGMQYMKLDIKILMLEIFGEALATKDITKMGELFRKKVDEL